MSTHSRVPAGVTTGGQFSTSARGEADVTLASDPYEAHATALGQRLAAAVGADQVADVELSRDVSCGAPEGARHLKLTVDVPGTSIGERVVAGGYLMPDGSVRELTLESQWFDPYEDDGDELRDGVQMPFEPQRTGEYLESHVETARMIGRHQRALDDAINQPQRRRRGPLNGYFEILHATAACDSQGRPVVEVVNGRRKGASKVLLRLDECRRVESMAVGTDFGLLTVGEADRDKVAGSLDRDLAYELGEDLGTDPSIWGVASLSRRMAGAIPQDD
ncbi:hypothetical protein [Cellulosimicrobium sp. Marseille-Q4280]|uniref:hypothetical protein n=1 Tax=Cellulosimicrobium sp. Marseille-Q4280 TaxID=2937992 RepID=UPI00204101B6|nr:hypothetical protein [Cellulosimicrobium sp. Marseille-Q4280]